MDTTKPPIDPPPYVSIIKVKSADKMSAIKPPKLHLDVPPRLCMCYALKPVLIMCNIFGLLPITVQHLDGRCLYKRSNKLLAYTVLLVAAYTCHFLYFSELLHFVTKRPLPELLNAINDVGYWAFVITLTALNLLRFPRFVRCFNQLNDVIREAELVCDSGFLMLRRINHGYLSLFVVLVVVQICIVAWLHTSERVVSNFDHRIVFNVGIRNVPFIFYMLFMGMCSTFISYLGCFERLVIKALHFRPVHPMKDIDETNNKQKFVGLIECELCRGDHKCNKRMLELSPPEQVEYLRSLHEDLSLSMYEFNGCLNPQLLYFSVVELTVLIIHWYEVIVYTSYTFSTPLAFTINVLSWTFVIAHSLGLFLFLKSAQDLKNMIQGLTNILLEYSTRISTNEEHQQVRLFIEKLKLHRPFTASGVFTIDLGIAAPISANILTYVLVALQFDIPKD